MGLFPLPQCRNAGEGVEQRHRRCERSEGGACQTCSRKQESMKLRHNPASPYVRKVMVVAHELGFAGRIELLSTAVSPVETNATLAAENPLMKIPALTTDDGEVLFDSPVICEYLDSLAGGDKVFPATGKARWTALRQQALGDGILDALILCRYEIAARPEEKRHAAWTDGQMKKAHQGLGALEREDLSGPRTIGP